MRIIESKKYNEIITAEKKKKYNEYAVCTESIGKTEGTTKRSEWSEGAEERYKKCKEEVKKQNKGQKTKKNKKKD